MEISKRFDLNGEDVLNNIRVARVRLRATRTRPPSRRMWRRPTGCGVLQVYTPDHLESSLKKAAAMLVAEEYRLLVVDSIIAPFRFEYCGRALPIRRPPQSSQRQQPTEDGRRRHELFSGQAPALACQAWRAGGEATEARCRSRHAQEDG